MFHRKHNNQTVGDHSKAVYTNVPVGAGGAGVANYPEKQKVGYGYEAGRDVNMQPGYAYDNNGNVQKSGYRGDAHVHQTPVSYGPSGEPIAAYPKKKSNRAANWCAAAFVACWACTWPCHGPCCCGF